MKKLLLLLSFFATSLFSISQTTYVPDDNFEQALIDLGYDDVLDDYVLTANINTVTGLNVDNREIIDLTGIEDFTALKYFFCRDNQISELDISQNLELQHLYCENNQLTNIDVTQNSELTFLNIANNQLSSIDVSQNSQLNSLYINQNQLESIDLTQNSELEYFIGWSNLFTSIDLTLNSNLKLFWCTQNEFSSFDFSQNLALENIHIGSNALTEIDLELNESLTNLTILNSEITEIDLSKNTALQNLRIENSKITGINTNQNIELLFLEYQNNSLLTNIDVTENKELIFLIAEGNKFPVIDVSSNRKLTSLVVSESQLTVLNAKNGNNNKFTNFRTTGTPQLTCIQVDDATWSSENWTDIDAQATFSENCSDFQLTICDDDGDGISVFDLTSLNTDIIASQTAGDYTVTFYGLMTDAIDNNSPIASPNTYNNTQTPQTVFTRVENNATNEFEVLLIELTSIVHPVFPSTYEICDEDMDGFTEFNLDDLNADVLDLEDVTIAYYLSDADAQSESNPISSPFTNTIINVQTIYVRSESNIDESCFEISTIDFTAIPCTDLTYIPDDNFEQALIDLGYDDVIDNYVTTSNINTITNLNVDSKGIADLTGINDFAALKVLSCNNNYLTSLTPAIEDNYELRELYCRSNLIETINLSKLFVLTKLDCSYNKLDYLLTFYNTGLKELYCQNNKITGQTGLYLKQNYYLETLNCNNNELEVLDLTYSYNLKTITCNNNNLTELKLFSSNLTYFSAVNNNLTDLNARNSNYQNFTGFFATGNPDLYCIKTLDPNWCEINWTDIDSHTSFSVDCSTTFVPDDNFEQTLIDLGYDFVLDDYVLTANIDNVSSLDLSSKGINDLTGIEDFTDLTSLQVNDNDLSSLDLSLNLSLVDLNASNNLLTELNVKNGNNINFTSFNASGNSSLYCIQVDDNAWSQANWTNIDAQTSFSTDCSLVTNIPDDNFEQALIDLGYDFVLDDYVLTSNISGITDLDISSKSINDLTGLQDFVGLINFNCSNNNLSNFDISNSSSLTTLNAINNVLSVLNVSQNNSLINLDVSNNQLTSLNVQNGNNSNFTGFDATGNASLTCIQVDNIAWSQANWTNIDAQSDFSSDCGALTNIPDDNFEQALIDLGYDTVLDDYVITSNIIDIIDLDINNKSISDLSGIQAFESLENLNCSNNQIQTLGLYSLYNLKTLDCSNNLLTALDTAENWYLEKLYCENNQIESLILILNFSLTEFNCSNNSQLTELIIKNETNQLITDFSALNNPNLTCISVDDADYSATNWTNIDAQTSFSEFCETTYTYIPDNGFEQALSGYDDGIIDNYIFTSEIETITNLGLTGLGITDLTGIQDFTALEELDINENQLTTIDLSQNINLTRLHCQDNQLISLNLESNVLLRDLICVDNQLTSLELGENNLIYEIFCYNNNLSTFDVSGLTNLQWLSCQNNQLESLDFSENSSLTILESQNNQLEYLNLKNTVINTDEWLNITNNPNLTCVLVDDIELAENTFTNIDVQTSFGLTCIDDDGDGIPDGIEDLNGNGDLTDDDTDGDGIPDFLDTDDDGDSVETIDEISDPDGRTNDAIDTDNDGIPNYLDNDDDGDGVLSIDEDYNNNGDLTDDDLNNNGIPDYLDNLVSLSVNEVLLFEFNIYPNPFQNSFNINIEDKGTYKLYTINGQTIKIGELEIGNNTIDVKQLNSGMYFIELETFKGKMWSKLIKN